MTLWLLLNALGNAVLAVIAGASGAALLIYLIGRQDRPEDE